VTSKTTCIARTNRAFVRAVAGFAAFFAHRSLHSRAVVSVVALWFERAFAIGALVLRTREAQSAFVGRAAAFAAPLHSRAIILVVALRLERALAIDALVFWTRNAQSAFVGRAAAFAAFGVSTFGC
jgi:hypothetical protein